MVAGKHLVSFIKNYKYMRKLYLVVAVAVLAGCGAKTATIEGLTFDPSICTEKTLTMPDGESVVYDAYEDIYFVTNVEDSTYQTLNFYVPKGCPCRAPWKRPPSRTRT